jgi:hypothetical protein
MCIFPPFYLCPFLFIAWTFGGRVGCCHSLALVVFMASRGSKAQAIAAGGSKKATSASKKLGFSMCTNVGVSDAVFAASGQYVSRGVLYHHHHWLVAMLGID